MFGRRSESRDLRFLHVARLTNTSGRSQELRLLQDLSYIYIFKNLYVLFILYSLHVFILLFISYSLLFRNALSDKVPQDGGLQALRLPGARPLQRPKGPRGCEHPDAPHGRHHEALKVENRRVKAQVRSVGLRRGRLLGPRSLLALCRHHGSEKVVNLISMALSSCFLASAGDWAETQYQVIEAESNEGWAGFGSSSPFDVFISTRKSIADVSDVDTSWAIHFSFEAD